MSHMRPFGLKDKIGYLFGDLGNNFSFAFAGSYLMVFYTKVLGLSGAFVGALFLAARIVDAFTDITMGRIVDTMPSAKDGRFRPWLRRMCVPVALTSMLLYLHWVAAWPYWAKVIYVIVTYIVWGSFCYTAVNIPYGSMASVISHEAEDRAALSTYRSVGASLAGLAIGTVVPLFIYETDSMGNQLVMPMRFTVTAVCFGVLAFLCYVICYKLCRERVSFEGESQNQKEKAGAGAIIISLVKNRSLISLVFAALILLLATMLGQTMNNYLFMDYFRNAKALSLLNLVSIGGMLIVSPFVKRIATDFGKKEAGAIGMLVSGIIYVLLFFFRVKSIPLFLVLIFLGTLGVGLFNLITWAFITDIIDHQEVLTGKREDGTVYAIYSFARKLGQALAGGIGGFALSAIGYVSEAAAQTALVTERIYSVAVLVPGICYLVVFLIMQFWYPLNKHQVTRNTELLQKRREGR